MITAEALRRRRRTAPFALAFAAAALLGAACDDASSNEDSDTAAADTAGDTGGADTVLPGDTTDDTTDDDTADTTGGDTGDGDTADDADTSGGDADTTPSDVEPDLGPDCATTTCPPGQHCELDAGGATLCVDDTCADLDCSATERCETPPGGGPATCVDISCQTSSDCAPSEFCDGAICAADVCTPGQRYCAGASVWACPADGSGEVPIVTCGGVSSFPSVCQDDAAGYAACSCQDDWDCPANTVCEAGLCRGDGTAPTCFLPPEPFSNVLPTPEIVWGADLPNQSNPLLPFGESIQGSMAPMVANLTDDNGDGLINELDFPEVIFMTYAGTVYTTNGVLRAVHGGGPDKGLDYFATLGSTVWRKGEPLPTGYNISAGNVDPTSSLAVGDLDGDGIPEIVAVGESNQIALFDNTGEPISLRTATLDGANPSPSLANVDHEGFSEIVIGRHVFTLDHDASGALVVVDQFTGTGQDGTNGQGAIGCVADLLGDERLEVIAGGTVYRFPEPRTGWTRRADCDGSQTTPDEVAFCSGQLRVEWNAGVAGFCAVADVLGADQVADPSPQNPPDGVPEVILVADGTLRVFNGQDGTQRRNIALNAGTRGGAPNVDDFDGDGLPEIGTASATAYVMIDLQSASAACPAWPDTFVDGQPTPANNPPRTGGGTPCVSDLDCAAGEAVCNLEIGQCACLHNGWRRFTEDDSSRVTGSTLFDFNGDGTAEVVYNDECFFRVYDGTNGEVLFREPSQSRTRVEFPIVADIDNDGNAEIAFTSNIDVATCSQDTDPDGQGGQWRDHYNGGLEVWGDAGDFWVSARRIWNQHSYHVTHVHEDGSIPRMQVPHWLAYDGRHYNTYRSQPRTRGIAPDLVTSRIQLVAPGAGCGTLGDQIDIVATLLNDGSVRVGPGVVVSFLGTWGATTEPLLDGAGQPLQAVVQTSLEPGGSLQVTVSYDAANNPAGTLPDSIEVVVDAAGQERECDETNNSRTTLVESGSAQADLELALEAPDLTGCPATIAIAGTLFNRGSAPASNITVRFFAGDPSAGGTVLHDELVAGPIAPGGSAPLAVTLSTFPVNTTFTIWAVADPTDTIAECNDGNNAASAPQTARCDLN